MQPDIYKVTELGAGFLAVMAKPIAGEWIADEFHGISRFGIKRLVSLLETHEVRELGLSTALALCLVNGIDYVSYPIRDRAVPQSVAPTCRLIDRIYQGILSGENTVIHCRAGIGRTGVLAAAVLVRHGIAVPQAFALVSKARGIPVPDTPDQSEWVCRHQNEIMSAKWTY